MEHEIIIETGHQPIYGKYSGDPGNSLILGLHGWSQRNGWHTWQPLMKPLAEAGHYVVCVDMPGWGRSLAWDKGPISSETAVSAVMMIIDFLQFESATLMGKSWGGGIALEAGLQFPERIKYLVLTAPAFRDLDRLSSLAQPVLLAWAKDDPVIPVRFAYEYKSIIPDIETVIYNGGGHSAAPKNPTDFAQRAIQFLRQKDTAGKESLS